MKPAEEVEKTCFQLDKLLEQCQAKILQVSLEVPGQQGLPRKKRIPFRALPVYAPPAAVVAPPKDAAEKSRFSEKSHPKKPLLLFLAAGVFLAAVVWQKRTPASSKIHSSFPLPYASTAGLANEKGVFSSIDPQRQLLFTFEFNQAKVKSVRKFSNPAASGLAKGAGSFWSTDAAGGYIYRHNIDKEYSISQTYANPDQSPSAIYWDGEYLWVSDLRTETIYQYSVNGSLVPTKQYTLPGIVPAGIHAANNVLWVLDAVSRKVYRYKTGALLTGLDWADLSPWLPSQGKATGFSADASAMWVITENPAALHRFDLKHLKFSK